MDYMQVVGALKHLERKMGRSPGLRDIAEEAGCSVGTVRACLQRALGEGLIAQRDGQYMTLEIARAYRKDE